MYKSKELFGFDLSDSSAWLKRLLYECSSGHSEQVMQSSAEPASQPGEHRQCSSVNASKPTFPGQAIQESKSKSSSRPASQIEQHRQYSSTNASKPTSPGEAIQKSRSNSPSLIGQSSLPEMTNQQHLTVPRHWGKSLAWKPSSDHEISPL